MPTVDVYIRVSRVAGRERLISPEEQERDARRFAQERGLTVGEVITDIDRSGGTLERPGLQTALARVHEGRSEGIVVAYLSRLSRETAQGLALIEEIREAGGNVYAPNLSDHTTADGRMLNTIQLAIDAGMRERSAEQIDRARARAIENGVPVTNRDAVGYRRNARRHYEPDPRVAPVIREAFALKAGGAPSSEVARMFEAHGIRTSQGSHTWTRQAVDALIRSRTYLGELRSGPHVNPVAHEPLIDAATWAAANTPRRALQASRRRDGYLLSGILRCRHCGYCMQGTRTPAPRRKRVYRCVGRHSGGVCPSPARIDADVVEARVLAEIRGMMVERRGRASRAPELEALTADLEAARRRLAQASTDEAQDALGDGWAATVKRHRLAVEAATLALGQAQASHPRGFWDAYEAFDIEAATRDELRRVIAGTFLYVAIDREKVIHWPPGDDDPPAPMLSRRGYNREPGLNPLPEYPADEA